MSLWKVAWRSIQQRSLSSVLTAVAMGLGVALVVCVLVIHGVVKKSFDRGAGGYNLIVGANKGGQLQLVLNTVYHLSRPIGNIPYTYYEWLVDRPYVEAAYPLCMGGSYKDHRIVGTMPDMFEDLEYGDGQKYAFEEPNRNFYYDEYFCAVVGPTAARKTGLKLGDTFQVTHGVKEGGEAHADKFTVVGIFEPTGTPNDRAIFVNIEGFFRLKGHIHAEPDAVDLKETTAFPAGEKPDTPATADEPEHDDHAPEHAEAGVPEDPEDGHAHEADGHDDEAAHAEDHAEDSHAGHDHGGDIPSELKKVTAILVCTSEENLVEAMNLQREINGDTIGQAVVPGEVITELFDGIVGNVQLVLLILVVMVVVVAGLGLLVSIYNSMSERRHDIAVMRALGASRVTVMVIILLESILLSLGGGFIGLLLGHGTIGAFSTRITEETGVAVRAMQFQPTELILIPGLIILASIVGYLPALSAYRTDVAKSLQS